jgi:hypothetical protein
MALPAEQETMVAERQVGMVVNGEQGMAGAALHPDPGRIASRNTQVVAAPAEVAVALVDLAALLVLRYSMSRSMCMIIESMSLPVPAVQSCSRGSYYHILPRMHSR